MATKRLHGTDAIEFVEQHGGTLSAYDWHRQGEPAAPEESQLTVEEAKAVVQERPWLVYVDVEDSDET